MEAWKSTRLAGARVGGVLSLRDAAGGEKEKRWAAAPWAGERDAPQGALRQEDSAGPDIRPPVCGEGEARRRERRLGSARGREERKRSVRRSAGREWGLAQRPLRTSRGVSEGSLGAEEPQGRVRRGRLARLHAPGEAEAGEADPPPGPAGGLDLEPLGGREGGEGGPPGRRGKRQRVLREDRVRGHAEVADAAGAEEVERDLRAPGKRGRRSGAAAERAGGGGSGEAGGTAGGGAGEARARAMSCTATFRSAWRRSSREENSCGAEERAAAVGFPKGRGSTREGQTAASHCQGRAALRLPLRPRAPWRGREAATHGGLEALQDAPVKLRQNHAREELCAHRARRSR